jgi:hypothetical protein
MPTKEVFQRIKVLKKPKERKKKKKKLSAYHFFFHSETVDTIQELACAPPLLKMLYKY